MQVSALIYTMGREAEHVLKSFTLVEEDDSKIGVILAKVDEHFVLKRHIIHKRARFHKGIKTKERWSNRSYEASMN